MEDFATETNDSVSMDDTIASAWNDIQNRGDETDDSTIEREQNSQNTNETEEKVEAEKPEPVVEAKKSPISWTKDLADKHWSALPPELQDEILRREEAFGKGIEKYRTSAQIGDAFTEILKPYMNNISAAGVDPGVAINHLFQTENLLRNGSAEQKVHLIHQMMNDYGIDPQALFGVVQNAPKQDPQVQQLFQRLNQLESQRRQDIQSLQQKEIQDASNEVQKFADGKPHFEEVRNTMADLLSSGTAKDLQEAYDMAVYAVPSVRAQLLAQRDAEAKAELDKAAKAAKKAASVNVTQRGVLPSKPAASGSMEETIRNTARELGII